MGSAPDGCHELGQQLFPAPLPAVGCRTSTVLVEAVSVRTSSRGPALAEGAPGKVPQDLAANAQ